MNLFCYSSITICTFTSASLSTTDGTAQYTGITTPRATFTCSSSSCRIKSNGSGRSASGGNINSSSSDGCRSKRRGSDRSIVEVEVVVLLLHTYCNAIAYANFMV
ncbi:hypothetical protein DPMN_156971 [Dreissena polymorpha]|uniref:Uncharacterized protein n=1 Tax=Dreissena polymorpha TaxID=45954 RepID=A0A9D4JBA1_DREPO|nr:hypothetical protein DPMN_156971 [Dreissena polymorpha]